jgi:hypothetical protein
MYKDIAKGNKRIKAFSDIVESLLSVWKGIAYEPIN